MPVEVLQGSLLSEVFVVEKEGLRALLLQFLLMVVEAAMVSGGRAVCGRTAITRFVRSFYSSRPPVVKGFDLRGALLTCFDQPCRSCVVCRYR